MYTVSATSADAAMGSASVSATSVVAGTSVTATATANSGYHFVNWTSNGNAVSTANPYTFTVNADIALVANFEADSTAPQPEMYTVSATSADAAMGSATVSATRVAAGTSVTATATANNGYHFTNWTAAGTVVSTANPYTFTVSADIALTANFEANGTEPEECVDPTDVAASDVTSTSATISWTAGGSETRWAIDWGTGADTTANNPYTLTGLEPNTTYYVKVKALCADGNESGWSSPATFTTATVGIDDVDAAAVSLYPNPATTTVTISGISGQATVTVVDMNGREVHTQTIKHSSNQTITLDLTGYAQGAYFVRIVGEQQSAVRKLIVK
jgi:hypothetical protein